MIKNSRIGLVISLTLMSLSSGVWLNRAIAQLVNRDLTRLNLIDDEGDSVRKQVSRLGSKSKAKLTCPLDIRFTDEPRY